MNSAQLLDLVDQFQDGESLELPISGNVITDPDKIIQDDSHDEEKGCDICTDTGKPSENGLNTKENIDQGLVLIN